MRLPRRRFLCLPLLGGLAACQREADPAPPAWPEAILPDLNWSLAEPLQASPASLLEALQRYAQAIDTRVDLAELQTRFPAAALDIRFHHWERSAAGDGREIAQELRIRSPQAPSYLEILYALHQAAQPSLRHQDHRYFEGLWLQDSHLEPGVALYLLHTGS